jgi:putative endonuclease
MKEYYVYILASKKNGTLYIGVTNNIFRRILEHKEHKIKGFTDKYSVNRLVWYQSTNNIYNAIEYEKQLKQWHRQWKINLIEYDNPTWKDLSLDFMDPETSSG